MKVKRIIKIEEEIIAEMEKFPHRAIKIVKNRDCSVADAILNSKPYDDSGDCISREALKEAIEEVEDNYDGYEPNDLGKFMNKVYDLIDNAPKVFDCRSCKNNGNERECVDCHDYCNFVRYEARPQGKWIEENGLIACSNCHTIWLYRRTKFCPNCGADMRGGAE